MNYINFPDILPEGVRHTTFFSHLYNHGAGLAYAYVPVEKNEHKGETT